MLGAVRNQKNAKQFKGQVSTELLIIIGLVLVVFIPLLVLVYFKAGEAQNEMGAYQAQLVTFRLAYLANSVGSLGTATTVYTDLYIPKNTISLVAVNVGIGSEIQLKIQSPTGESDVVEVVKYPIVPDKGSTTARLVDAPTYGWARFRISSEYDPDGKARIRIEREK
jgi:type II secretory pathway pseudopilin PulG